MTFHAVIVDVAVPADAYDATHDELLRRSGGHVDGLVVHLGRATADGFQVIEVWTDRAARERVDRELLGPILTELAAPTGGPAIPPPRVEEFTLRGFVVPAAGIAT